LPKLQQKISQKIIQIKNDHCSISIYTDKLTAEGISVNTLKIKKSFPSLPIEFYDILQQRIKDRKFTDQRLTDAVNNVIDTCIYPHPTIAQFINFDKNIEAFTFQQISEKMIKDRDIMQRYKPVEFGGRVLWVNLCEIKKYNLKIKGSSRRK
jgi:hypothetical protein